MAHAPWAKKTMVELLLIGTTGSQTIINVHAFEASEALDLTFISDGLADAAAIALRDDWITNMLTNYRALHGTLYNLVTVGSQVVERPGQKDHRLGRQDRTSAPLPAAGTFTTAGGMEDMQVAAVIRWRSLLATRHARGRTYIGGLSQDATDVANVGHVSSAYLANMNTYGAGMIARYSPTGTHPDWNFTIYSRPYDSPHGDYPRKVHGGGYEVVPKGDYNGDSNFVTSHFADSVTRTQRRREFGVGV